MSEVARITPTEFNRRLTRLAAKLGIHSQEDIARALGMSLDALCNLRLRGLFPERDLRSLARHRPDLEIDVEYVLAGRRPRPEGVSPHQAPGAPDRSYSRQRERLQWEALKKQVPAMARGFCIVTTDGEIHVGSGSFADVMQALVRTSIVDELFGGDAG